MRGKEQTMPMPMGGPPPKRQMSDGIPKPGNIKGVPRYLYKKVKGFLSRLFYIISLVWRASPIVLVAMCVLCAVNGVLPVAGAYISRDLLNVIAVALGNGPPSPETPFIQVLSPVLFILLFQLIYSFLSRVLGRVDKMINGLAGELVVNHIKLQIIGKAKTVDQRSFDNPKFYEKLENANREAGMRPIGILVATFSVISACISVGSFIVVLSTLSPLAPLVVIIASIPGALVNYYFKNRNFRYVRHHSKERRQMNYYSDIMTNKDYVKEVKILGLGDEFTSKYKKAFKKYYRGIKSIIVREGITQSLVSLVYVVCSCALFLFVAYRVIYAKDGQIGDYSLYSGALNSITAYVSTIVTSTATIYEGTLFIENMIDFMREDVTVVPIGEPITPARGVPHTIELKNVSFHYPGCSDMVISNMNLTLKTGESVVLVGLNGAGKSTLIKLITRLYDPTEGEILLDGVDIRRYDVKALYDIYGIIFQDFGKYADTVSENIRFGDIDRAAEAVEIAEAARHGNAESFINELPRGYETPLTRLFEEDGIELSGGQWQKLSIARAFYKNSDILIMDEPTASLDPLAEQDVFNRFATLSENKLSIFVSHRLSGAVTAGKIVVLEDGKIVEVGTHEQLMELGEKYYLLFSTQAKRYIE